MGLDRRAIGNSLVRMNSVTELLTTEVVRQKLTHLRDTRGATHHYNLGDLVLADLGITKNLVKRPHTLLEERLAQLLELRSRHRKKKILSIHQ